MTKTETMPTKAEARADVELFGSWVEAALRDPDRMPDRLVMLSLTDEGPERLLTPKRLELIQALQRLKEPTISELAQALKRRLDTVSRDLKALAKHGIVELRREGRTKRVQLAADLVLLCLRQQRGH